MDDAKLIDYFIRDVAQLNDFSLFTHDKGDSVGLALLELYQAYQNKPYHINHHFITNGNIYLPLARLTSFQKQLLNHQSGPTLSSTLNGTILANFLAEATYSTELSTDELASLASIFYYQEGAKIQNDVIQYLAQRDQFEVSWLETLNKSDIPTTLIWGEEDQIAPTRVSDYVWENYVKNRDATSSYWRIPYANHYLQNDRPHDISSIVQYELRNGHYLDFSKDENAPYRIFNLDLP